MDMSALVALGATAAEAVKTAISLVRKGDLAALEKVLLDLRDDIAKLRDANIELRNENRDLREKLNTREGLTFAENVWWKLLDNGGREGPYCPKCYGDRDKAVRMGYHVYNFGPNYGVSRKYTCPVCDISIAAQTVPSKSG